MHTRRLVLWISAVLLVPVLCGAGVLAYLAERYTQSVGAAVGEGAKPDRVDLFVTAQQVNAAQQRLQLSVEIVPHGTLAESDGSPAKPLSVYTSSPTRAEIDLPAERAISAQNLDVSLYGGTVSDYPFDGYSADVGFAVYADGKPVPVSITFSEIDPFFRIATVDGAYQNSSAELTVHVSRAQGTKFLAVFMMVVMWALALSVLGGAYILVSRRRGLVWPALGWMAATLFALAGMRNTAPGSPPVGCVLDYAAFFWAELLTAVGVVAVSVFGVLTERRKEPLTGWRRPRPSTTTEP
jgi:hypothetical protein